MFYFSRKLELVGMSKLPVVLAVLCRSFVDSVVQSHTFLRPHHLYTFLWLVTFSSLTIPFPFPFLVLSFFFILFFVFLLFFPHFFRSPILFFLTPYFFLPFTPSVFLSLLSPLVTPPLLLACSLSHSYLSWELFLHSAFFLHPPSPPPFFSIGCFSFHFVLPQAVPPFILSSPRFLLPFSLPSYLPASSLEKSPPAFSLVSVHGKIVVVWILWMLEGLW